jgi:hypothetical protein
MAGRHGVLDVKPRVEAIFRGDCPRSVGIDERAHQPADIRRVLAPKPPRFFNGKARAGIGVIRLRLSRRPDGVPPGQFGLCRIGNASRSGLLGDQFNKMIRKKPVIGGFRRYIILCHTFLLWRRLS